MRRHASLMFCRLAETGLGFSWAPLKVSVASWAHSGAIVVILGGTSETSFDSLWPVCVTVAATLKHLGSPWSPTAPTTEATEKLNTIETCVRVIDVCVYQRWGGQLAPPVYSS
eukprot:2029717-Pyramimonas_sp.AAC.1